MEDGGADLLYILINNFQLLVDFTLSPECGWDFSEPVVEQAVYLKHDCVFSRFHRVQYTQMVSFFFKLV